MKPCAELFVDLLKSEDFKFQTATDGDGDTVVSIAFQGKLSTIFFSGDTGNYLSIYTVFEHISDDKLADVIFTCNELNAQYKWVTFYVDKDNDLILHDDAILSIDNAAVESFELLLRTVKIAEDAKPKIMKAIYA